MDFEQATGTLKLLCTNCKKGIGFPYDLGGKEVAYSIERFFAPVYRHLLVSDLLSQLEGAIELLQKGWFQNVELKANIPP